MGPVSRTVWVVSLICRSSFQFSRTSCQSEVWSWSKEKGVKATRLGITSRLEERLLKCKKAVACHHPQKEPIGKSAPGAGASFGKGSKAGSFFNKREEKYANQQLGEGGEKEPKMGNQLNSVPSNQNIESSSKSVAGIIDSGNKGDMFDPFGMATASNAKSITSSEN